MSYKRKNLFALEFDFKNGVSELKHVDNVFVEKFDSVHDVEKDSFYANEEKGTWGFFEWRNMKIGETRSFYDRYLFDMILSGVVGVYDTTDKKHREDLNLAETKAQDTYKKLMIPKEP